MRALKKIVIAIFELRAWMLPDTSISCAPDEPDAACPSKRTAAIHMSTELLIGHAWSTKAAELHICARAVQYSCSAPCLFMLIIIPV
eukprot:264332-Pleurochrysis_carterae.AAC.1